VIVLDPVSGGAAKSPRMFESTELPHLSSWGSTKILHSRSTDSNRTGSVAVAVVVKLDDAILLGGGIADDV